MNWTTPTRDQSDTHSCLADHRDSVFGDRNGASGSIDVTTFDNLAGIENFQILADGTLLKTENNRSVAYVCDAGGIRPGHG